MIVPHHSAVQTTISYPGQMRSMRRVLVAILIWGAWPSGYSCSFAEERPSMPTNGGIRIRAVDTAGQAIPNAQVHVSIWTTEKDFTANRDYQCDSDGWATLKLPATLEIVRVRVRSPGYAPMFAQLWPQSRFGSPPLPSEFTYKLTKGTTIGGVVKNDDGQPIEGARVEVKYEDGGDDFGAPTPTSYDAWLANDEGAQATDAEGRWSLDNVPPGDKVDVRIKLSHADYIHDTNWGGLQKEQDVSMKQLRDQTATIAMHRGYFVKGRVTDPDGQPVKNAVVIWGDRPYWDDGSQEVLSDADGNYRLGPLPSGTMRITVAAVGWMPQMRKIEIGPSRVSEDFKLQPGKKLRLKFVDAVGKPVPNVHVQVSDWRGAESLYSHRHPNVVDLQIPMAADDNGVFEWSWAPDDAVKYTFYKNGYANVEASIVADDTEKLQTIHPLLEIAGTVSDATNGKPIERFRVVPVIHFRPDFPLLNRSDAKDGENGVFSVAFDRTDIEHGVQIEAPGYVTFRTDRRYVVGETNPQLDVKLQPTTPYIGKVVADDGQPVKDARVFVATNFQHLDLHNLEDRDGDFSNNYGVVTQSDGEFEIVPQRDRYALVVVSLTGYAKAERTASEPPGSLCVQPWARVKGLLKQDGKPMPKCRVYFEPIEFVGGDQPRIDLRLSAETASDGSFAFDRVPPIAGRVRSFLHFSVDSPLKSSRSVPLELLPGSEASLELGGEGAEVVGTFEVDPPRTPFDYHFSLTYLVAKGEGIKTPPSLADKGFDWRKGWTDSWFKSQEGGAYLNTLHNWFVKPDPDGNFRISGVPPGEYELAVNLYGTTEGCLVHPVAQRVMPIEIAADQPLVDLGKVIIPTQDVPKVGDLAKNFEFESPDGKSTDLDAQRGKYVLVDFWATWCGPCITKIPEVEALRKQFDGAQKLIVLGANLDSDPSGTREFLKENPLAWHHAFLGDWSSTDVPKRYGISTVPAYVLVDPEGRIAAIEYSIDKIHEHLSKSIDAK